jgi:hypothetical protein
MPLSPLNDEEPKHEPHGSRRRRNIPGDDFSDPSVETFAFGFSGDRRTGMQFGL